MGKPAPMDDDVLTLARKCAETVHGEAYENGGCIWLHRWKSLTFTEPRTEVDRFSIRYDPLHDDFRAFELLCWLAASGEIKLDFEHFFFGYWEQHIGNIEYRCSTPAELRLAIMRAVCKVKEGK